jgi:hypothetical protein
VLRLGNWGLRPFPAFAVALAAALSLLPFGGASAQGQSQNPGQEKEGAVVSRGENFSAKPAPALFASDCTGGGCHKEPQGLAKGQSQAGLSSFLREHYTNSRESARALAAYLIKLPSAPPSEARASKPRPATRSSRVSAQPEEAAPKPTSRGSRGNRGQRSAAVPPMPPEPPAPPASPPPKQFDIFD